MVSSNRKQRLEALLDAALALPPTDRDRFLAKACKDDPELRRRLTSLLFHAERPDGFLERSPLARPGDQTALPSALIAGERFGAFRLVGRLGVGGMGEVWLGERIDGGFRQQVAIKCLRTESSSLLARFDAERAILASLDHPGIARLYDGGIAEDGRAYMVMEYVQGQDLLAWCQQRGAGLERRLSLFLEACEAVAHAHTHLVIHRDLKPANILVTPEGRVKLLDFGIAKLLQQEGMPDATATAHLSPAYAATEQLTGGGITTATDVHALGATLYQLLTGELPWRVEGLPLGLAVQRLLTESPAAPSRIARAGAPVPARWLRGDLDAIVQKALRKEPESRYPDARALGEDIERYRRHEPVSARSGARLYVARRFLRRHWLPMGATATLFAVLVAATVAVAWQAQRAADQAERANVIRDYLVRVFEASDPRIASDRPRGQITARELLDVGTRRIDDEFADRPDLHIELLGLTAGIYRELGAAGRYADLHRRHMELALRHYGVLHPVVLEGRLRDADDAVLHHDYAAALSIVEEIDPLITRAGLDDSPVRAKWWLRKGNALEADPARWSERMAALTEAVSQFERIDPGDREYMVALGNVAVAHWERGGPDADTLTRDWLLRAVAAGEGLRERNDGELLVLYANLGHVQESLGDADGADAASSRALELARMTYGESDRRYWHAIASRASTLHRRGERVEALRLFEAMYALLPENPGLEDQDIAGLALTLYGHALVRDGRPRDALPILQAAERGYLRANRGGRLTFLRRALGEAFEGSQQAEAARRQLEMSVEGLVFEHQPDSAPVLAGRERLGRLLLRQGDLARAESELRDVIALGGEANLLPAALAHAALAELELGRGDTDAALHAIRQGLIVFEAVAESADIRTGPYLWAIEARALLLAGERTQARARAEQALDAYLRYNHPESLEIAELRALLAQAS